MAGWAFQWICQLGFARDSWTAPVDARRLHPLDDTDQTAAMQVRALLARLPAGGPVPWFVFDAGYDSAQLSLDLTEAPVAVLVRLRSDRCFYHDPPPRPPGAGGRPRRHGAKFAFADPATWPAPTATLTCQDDQYGTVTVTVICWAGLHPKQHRHPGHGSGGPRPIVRGTILRVQVERVPARTRPPKVLWLWWAGPGQLDLDLAWRAYTRRFDLEHTIRFAKQTLGWTTPRLRHPAQADRWTWLVLAGYTQLRLPDSSPRTHGCRGSGPDRPASCPPTGCGRVSATSGRTRLTGCCAETLRALPWSPQRPPLRPRPTPSRGQQAHQEGPEDADQGQGRLTSTVDTKPQKPAAHPARPRG